VFDIPVKDNTCSQCNKPVKPLPPAVQ
jgi:hypothetical protein